MSELPSKLFFRIGEVAGLVGVEPHVLRYWEREFRSIRPTKSAKGQRVYSRKDVENLLRVRDLLYRDGFTIAGAKKKLQRNGAEPGAADLAAAMSAHPTEPQIVPAVAAVAHAVAAAPVLTPAASTESNRAVRERLLSLRTEVESFLSELESSRG